jgi:carbamoyl-phosphate synthase large subunit
MEHVERTGIHSGDSIAVHPAPNIDQGLADNILETTKKICVGLKVAGIINIQYVVVRRELFVIEVNPRASRTVPYLSKVTGVPMVELATRVSLGERLLDLGFGSGIYEPTPYTAVKVPVFSFEKLTDVDTHLGPEMKSTGEVLGIGKNLQEALYKGLLSAGCSLVKAGSVFISVRDAEKPEIAAIADKFHKIGFELYATSGTADVLSEAGLRVQRVHKIHENENNVMTLLESGEINYIISTSTKGRNPERDSVKIRRKASQLGIPCLTSLDTANAVADSLMSGYTPDNTDLIDINNLSNLTQKSKTK